MCVRARLDASCKEEKPDLDPRIAAAVLTLLLYIFSAQNQSPSRGPVQPPADAHGVTIPSGAQAKQPARPPDAASSGRVSPALPGDSTVSHQQAAAALGKARPVPDIDPGTTTRVTERARLRKGPGTSYATMAKVSPSTGLTVLARHDDWYQVRLEDERVGWIAGFLIRDPAGASGRSQVPAPAPTDPGGPSQGLPGARRVLGYYTEDYPRDPTSYGSLLRGKGVLDSIAAFLHPVDASGRVSGDASERAVAAARSGGMRALALVHNLTASGFDASRAHALLQNTNSRARAISDILDILERGKYHGVNIDLENVYPSDRENLTAFMQELAARLRPRGYLVTISVPAKTADHSGADWVGAFDYYALGRVCDQVMLMTYDEHAWSSGPGPVASYNWVEKVVRYAITQMPRSKILMGIPAYGYDWDLASGRVTALSYTRVMNRARSLGIDPSWDATAKSPYFKYTDGRGARHEVWFESSHSISPKLDLVTRYDLGGVAIWKLGYEDDAYWEVIRRKLR